MIKAVKKLLQESGMSDKTAEDLCVQISREIGLATVPKKEYNAKTETCKALQTVVTQKDTEMEMLKVRLQQEKVRRIQLETSKSAYDVETNNLKSEIKNLMIERAIDQQLAKSGAKNIKAVKSLLDLSKISVSANDRVTGLDEQLNMLMNTDGYMFLPQPAITVPYRFNQKHYHRKRTRTF